MLVGERAKAGHELTARRADTAFALDRLDQEAGRDRVRRLSRDVDILVETFGPGHLDGADLGYPVLAEANPGLIVASLTPFGATGPWSHWLGEEIVGAAVGGYHDGENALADELEGSFGPSMLNLADRGFFSMYRWLRFSGTGAELAWRVKNGGKSVPLKTVKTLPDGSELVMLHESDGMRARRRKDAGDPHAERLPDTLARLAAERILGRAL